MINDIVKEYAHKRSGDVFICVENEKINYKIFHNLVEEIANSFDLSKYNNRIKLSFKSKKLLLASLIAINRLGKIPVIFPPKDKMLKNIDYDVIADIDCEINDNNCIIQDKYDNVKIYQYEENDVQCCLFTTGTTSGVPKCVELTFENIFCSATNWKEIYNFSRNDNYLSVLPLYYISGLSVFFRSMYNNFYSQYIDYDKNTLYNILLKNKTTCLSLVPKIFNDILSRSKGLDIIKKLQFIIIGGDSINYNIFKKCYDNNINLYASYGLTETASGIAGFWINKEKEYVEGFLGYPHINTNIFINNGLIGIKSKTVMKKYSLGSNTNGIHLTQDKGKIIDDKIYFIGRDKHLIISGGVNINLKNIENNLKEEFTDNEFAILPFKNDKWGETFIVIYQLEQSSSDLVRKIQEHCKKNLSDYMIPKHFMNIKNIPRYDNFKINYSKLNKYVKDNFK